MQLIVPRVLLFVKRCKEQFHSSMSRITPTMNYDVSASRDISEKDSGITGINKLSKYNFPQYIYEKYLS